MTHEVYMHNKVLILIESLEGGGAEKVLATMMRHIDKEHYDVSVLAICGGGKYEEEVASCVKYSCLLNRHDSYRGMSKLYYRLKYKLIYEWLPAWLVYLLFVPKGFDVEVAFVEGFATKVLAASSNKQAKKFAWVHSNLTLLPWTITNGIFKNVDDERRAYLNYDKVVCVSNSVEKVMVENYGLSSTITIYNPLDVLSIKQRGKEKSSYVVDHSKFNIVSVGRLAKEKGYDLLLPIIKNVKDVHPDVHLWLIGMGVEENSLKRQAADLGIEDNVTFTGFLKNPYSLMSQMDLFVCSSRAEGFSLVIAEAMILGLPVVSTNCSGPNELLSGGKYGILCETYDELEKSLIAVAGGAEIPTGIPPIINIDETMKAIYELFG